MSTVLRLSVHMSIHSTPSLDCEMTFCRRANKSSECEGHFIDYVFSPDHFFASKILMLTY